MTFDGRYPADSMKRQPWNSNHQPKTGTFRIRHALKRINHESGGANRFRRTKRQNPMPPIPAR